MDMRLVYFCIYIAEGITAWSYFSGLYKRRYSLWISVLAHILGYGIAFLIFNFAYVWVNTLMFTLINFALLYRLHFCSWKSGLFHAGLLTCFSIGLEFVIVLILGSSLGNYDHYQTNASTLMILAVCSKLLYFLATKLCLLIAKKSNPGQGDVGAVSLFLSFFSLATICVMVVMFYTGMAVHLPLHIENLMLISSLILLFANILLFAGYQYSQRVSQQYLALQMEKQKDEAKETYFRVLEEKYNGQRVLIHDIRRHLTAIKGLAQEQGTDSVVDYVNRMKELPALQNKVRYCDNPMLNVVLSHYGEICREKEIDFQVDVRDKEYDFLAPNDITSLFGNLLENAVDAAQGTPKPYVALRVDSPAGTDLFLSLTNPCNEPPIEDGRNGYLTRKLNKEQHGIGLKSVDAIVKKYGGSINHDYDWEAKLFHISVLLKSDE